MDSDDSDIARAGLGAGLFQAALEAAPIGMLLIDAGGTIVLANVQAERLFGCPRPSLVGASVENLVPERFREQHLGFRAHFGRDPSTRAMGVGRDLYALRRDGSEFPVEIGLNPIRSSEGSFILASVVDITERRRAMEQFRCAIEASPTGMLMVDLDGRIVLVNAQVEQLFHHPRERLIGERIEMLVPERFRGRHAAFRQDFLLGPTTRPMGAGRDLFGLRADGIEVPVEIGLNPIETPAGKFVLGSIVDISERKRAELERERLLVELRALNAALEARGRILGGSLRERETLLKEVHHRVKNNLQVISSLINLQARQHPDRAPRLALEDCQSRVQAMALIHEQLYASGDYSRIVLGTYVEQLARTVMVASESASARVALQVEVEAVSLPVDQAIPCGLILNELMTNALRHAFPNDRRGTVAVRLARAGHNEVRLSVADDGVGLSANPNAPSAAKTLGFQLIRTLTTQLNGRLHLADPPGTLVTVTFPVEIHDA